MVRFKKAGNWLQNKRLSKVFCSAINSYYWRSYFNKYSKQEKAWKQNKKSHIQLRRFQSKKHKRVSHLRKTETNYCLRQFHDVLLMYLHVKGWIHVTTITTLSLPPKKVFLTPYRNFCFLALFLYKLAYGKIGLQCET